VQAPMRGNRGKRNAIFGGEGKGKGINLLNKKSHAATGGAARKGGKKGEGGGVFACSGREKKKRGGKGENLSQASRTQKKKSTATVSLRFIVAQEGGKKKVGPTVVKGKREKAFTYSWPWGEGGGGGVKLLFCSGGEKGWKIIFFLIW